MKKNVRLFSSTAATVILLTAIVYNSSGQAASSPAAQAVVSAIDSSKWKFTATNVMPQYGTSRQADFNYDVTLSNNKLVVYLPYFGRADAGANTMTGKSPLDFTSTDFTVDKQQGKKGQRVITIKPNDYREVQSMVFTFYPNGNANLSISLTHRSGISYGGNVAAIK